MPTVQRVVRPAPGVIVTEDGYRYEWTAGGEAVDVLPQHRRTVLAMKGAHLIYVDVVDEPVIVPAFTVAEPVPDTLVAPTRRRDEQLDPKTLVIEPPVLPAEEPAPDVMIRPVPEPTPQLTPVVSDVWSAADVALLQAAGQ
jgi:hypothetical protein